MAEPGKQQIGDGQDNYAQVAKQAQNAAKNISGAAKEVGKDVAKTAAAKGAEATAHTAAATVKAGVETGKAVSEIAAGTAAGGPWGAIISAAWAMRHTLFKILVCICIFVVILITVVVSLPDIIFQNITDMFEEWFDGWFGNEEEIVEVNTLDASYDDLAIAVESTIKSAYKKAKDEAEDIISNSKYDSELSKAYFDDTIEDSYNYDVAYILSAYSVSMEQNGTSKEHLLNKLDNATNQLFTVVATEKTEEVTRKEGDESKTYEVTYVICTIEFYDQDKILEIFDIDKDAEYKEYGITCGEYVDFMTNALKNTVSSIQE